MTNINTLGDDLAKEASALTARIREFSAARHSTRAERGKGSDDRVRQALISLSAAAKDAARATRIYDT